MARTSLGCCRVDEANGRCGGGGSVRRRVLIAVDVSQLDKTPRPVPSHGDHGGGDFRAVNDPPPGSACTSGTVSVEAQPSEAVTAVCVTVGSILMLTGGYGGSDGSWPGPPTISTVG